MRNRMYGSMRYGRTPRAISLAAFATAALMGAAFAAPAPLALTQAQQLAIERSPQMAAYDAAIVATRD